ncbi:MAG: undecaprenyldiphospho-muramoylpentapeptide beta-N-acetylglucosaminyltransferase [Chitinophagales bacterium]
MKVIMAGGGTGGHIYPALAIAQGIQKKWPKSEMLFVGTRAGLEKTIIPETGLELRMITAEGLNRSSFTKAFSSALKVPMGFWQSRNIIKDFKPDLVIGTGGYVSYPVVLAASIMGIKTLIHEQNAYPGLANRALAKRADCVMLTFDEAASYLNARRVEVTGLPIRPDILSVNRATASSYFGLVEDRFTLVAFGGSRGAQSINKAMMGLIKKYNGTDVQIIWLTGEQHYRSIIEHLGEAGVPKNCRIYPYLLEMAMVLAAGDLAVCRAGAATLSELSVRGLPGILIPYPYAAESHQEKNARYLERKGAAITIVDEFLDADGLMQKVEQLKDNRFQLLRMAQLMKEEGRPGALENIINIIQEVSA